MTSIHERYAYMLDEQAVQMPLANIVCTLSVAMDTIHALTMLTLSVSDNTVEPIKSPGSVYCVFVPYASRLSQ